MAKKKNNQRKQVKQEEKPTLGDHLKDDILAKLKEKKSELKEEQRKTEEQETKRKEEERRQREKNKSFEDLLNDSQLDWKKFK